jgi:hypothetical protein
MTNVTTVDFRNDTLFAVERNSEAARDRLDLIDDINKLFLQADAVLTLLRGKADNGDNADPMVNGLWAVQDHFYRIRERVRHLETP